MSLHMMIMRCALNAHLATANQVFNVKNTSLNIWLHGKDFSGIYRANVMHNVYWKGHREKNEEICRDAWLTSCANHRLFAVPKPKE